MSFVGGEPFSFTLFYGLSLHSIAGPVHTAHL